MTPTFTGLFWSKTAGKLVPDNNQITGFYVNEGTRF